MKDASQLLKILVPVLMLLLICCVTSPKPAEIEIPVIEIYFPAFPNPEDDEGNLKFSYTEDGKILMDYSYFYAIMEYARQTENAVQQYEIMRSFLYNRNTGTLP